MKEKFSLLFCYYSKVRLLFYYSRPLSFVFLLLHALTGGQSKSNCPVVTFPDISLADSLSEETFNLILKYFLSLIQYVFAMDSDLFYFDLDIRDVVSRDLVCFSSQYRDFNVSVDLISVLRKSLPDVDCRQ